MTIANQNEWKEYFGYGFVLLCAALAFALVNWSCDYSAQLKRQATESKAVSP